MLNKSMNIYWANLCILNRMEAEKMEEAAVLWSKGREVTPNMVYLGDTEEIGMYEKMDNDIAREELGFDIIVSSRFDLFCSKKYLQSYKDRLLPIGRLFPVREEIKTLGLLDPDELFHPLAALPHYIMANTRLLGIDGFPHSFEELLQPKWEGKVFLGSTELPSAKAVLFSIWYLFGNEGLESAVKNWRQRSAPSAARHGLVKDEFPIALLPGIFGGPGPDDKLVRITPNEGAPVLPSWTAIKKSPIQDDCLDFLKHSALQTEFSEFYRSQALAYPTDPGVSLPETLTADEKMIFPPWEWIFKQDMDYFEDACRRTPLG